MLDTFSGSVQAVNDESSSIDAMVYEDIDSCTLVSPTNSNLQPILIQRNANTPHSKFLIRKP